MESGERMESIVKAILNDQDLRKQSILLRNYVKDHPKAKIDQQVMLKLLENSDNKVRKNACTILSYMQAAGYAKYLSGMYENESNYIVKCEIVKTLCSFPYMKTSPYLSSILASLSQPVEENNEKHRQSMIMDIVNVQAKNDEIDFPGYTRMQKPKDVVLTCFASNQELLYEHLDMRYKKKVSLGVMARINQFSDIETLRDFEDVLFPLKDFHKVPFQYQDIADHLDVEYLLGLLDEMHEASIYLFHIDTSNLDPGLLKNDFVSKLALAIQSKGDGRLINSTGNYAIEIVLYSIKGCCKPFLKLNTVHFTRFDYRQETLASSMRPILAASIVNLLRPYLKEHADVVDLCCGTGTLLIEREKVRKTHFMIGVDIYGEAIEKGKINASLADVPIHFVNRNLEDFKHHHLFDEVLTDLPILSNHMDRREVEDLYHAFLKKGIELTRTNGYIFVYTTNMDIFKKVLRFYKHDVKQVKVFEIALKNTTGGVFVLQVD